MNNKHNKELKKKQNYNLKADFEYLRQENYIVQK
jgi:hypothetical protein